MERKTIKTGILFREATIDRAKINVDARTVELSFSSETKVSRWFGAEILDHSPGSVRLDRLKDGGPLLVDHRMSDHIGVCESVEIGADRRGRATVRFGKGTRAQEIFQDVQDGIRTKISCAYAIHKMRLDGKEGGEDIYRATDWEPHEISFVAIPADPSVGVGRGNDPDPQHTITIEGTRAMSDQTPEQIRAAQAAEVATIRDNELRRITDIEQIGQQFKDFGGVEIARQFMKDGKTVAEMQAAMLEKIGKRTPPSADIGLNEREIKQFSFLRALTALANPGDRKLREAAGYEFECSEASAKRLGQTAKGIIVPMDVLRAPLINVAEGGMGNARTLDLLMRLLQQRDLNVGTSTAGGHTVATDLLASSFIDLLRKRMVLQRLGVTVLSGLVGNIAIPRQTGGATAYWVAESGAPTESQQAFDQVTMTPKTVGAFTDISRKLLLQSSIDVEAFVRRDIVTVLALEMDRVGFYGSGASNQPLGLDTTSGINTVNFGAAAPTYAEIVAMETEVASDNADIGTLAYAMSANGRGVLKTTDKASGAAQFVWEMGNTVNGYRAEVSNQISNGDFWFGNWADFVQGLWGGLDLMVDPYTGSTTGTVRVVALQDVDQCVRHPESFCQGNDNP